MKPVRREALLLLSLASPLVEVGASSLFVPYAEEQALAWSSYKAAFSSSLPYKTPLLQATVAEDAASFKHFLDSLQLADARNEAEGSTHVHGVTKYSRLSQREFERLVLGDELRIPSSYLAKVVDSPLATEEGALLRDWTGNLTTPVRDQGLCAAGWAFSAISQVESDAQRVLGVRHALSPQQILACDELHGKYCLGGWPEAAYAYVRRAGGLEKEVTYPYASAAGAEPSCTARADNFVVNAADASDSTGALSGYGSSPGYAISRESAKVTELAMAYHVANVGPLVVCIDASGFSTYVGGVLSVCGSTINHCVQVVGVHRPASSSSTTTTTGTTMTTTTTNTNSSSSSEALSWWRVRNSFGSDWGEGGYARLRFGADTCGITARPTFTVPSYAESLLRQAPDAADFPFTQSPQLIRRYRQL